MHRGFKQFFASVKLDDIRLGWGFSKKVKKFQKPTRNQIIKLSEGTFGRVFFEKNRKASKNGQKTHKFDFSRVLTFA